MADDDNSSIPRAGAGWGNILSLRRKSRGVEADAWIVDSDGYRLLCFASDGSVQTEMLLDDPYQLTNDYTRKMMGFAAFQPIAPEVVLLGLGGGSLVKFCHRHLPDAQVTAVEINAKVVALRSAFHIPADNERLHIVQADGAQYIAQLADGGKHVDAVLIDAYDRDGIAQEVVSCDFLAAVHRVIVNRGVLVMNLVADRGDCLKYLARLKAVFGRAMIVIAMRDSDNLVVFASEALLERNHTIWVAGNLKRLEGQLGLQFPTLWECLHDLHAKQ